MKKKKRLFTVRSLKNEIETSEGNYFLALEESENYQQERADALEFLSGSEKTLEVIKNEVQAAVAKDENEICNRLLRVKSLLDMCNPALKTMYIEVEGRFRNKNPVSFLIDKKCSECHMTADSMLKLSLEEGRSIEFCPSCGRLLIPETAKIY
jgi:predicted  nucleic acid-binding Zn-ribbon protein